MRRRPTRQGDGHETVHVGAGGAPGGRDDAGLGTTGLVSAAVHAAADLQPVFEPQPGRQPGRQLLRPGAAATAALARSAELADAGSGAVVVGTGCPLDT